MKRSEIPGLPPGFKPERVLWTGARAPYATQNAAKWQLRRLRPKLKSANAIAIFCGRNYVHEERVLAIIEQDALDHAAARVFVTESEAA